MIEIYSDHYYKSKLQGLVNKELKDDPEFASLPPKKKQARQFSVYLRIHAESWKNESDVVKAEIQNLFLEENEVKADQDDEENVDGNDSEIKEDDDDMYVMLCLSFFRYWFFYVGNRCSAGKTTDGRKFQDTHPNWQPGLISPWYDFLKLRHRK